MDSNNKLTKDLLYTPIINSFSKKPTINVTQNQSSSMDTVILLTAVILTMIGLITVYSITIHSGFSFLKGQIIRIIAGFIALIIASFVPYKYYQGRFKDILIVGTIILLIATLILGRKVAEAKRWALFFQPAEFAKYSLIIWLSGYFANLREKRKNYNVNQIKQDKCPVLPLLVVGLVITLLLLQPAVGTSVILTLSALFVFFISGVKLRYILLITLIGIAIFAVSIFTIPYAKKRFNEFRAGTTYQQLQSRIAIGSGGVLGKGLGEGKQKFYFLPKLHTDFIYSAIGEEFGLLGTFIILTLFYILFSRGLKVGIEVNDDFGLILVSGIVIVIFQYLLVHLGVALSLLPTTGQPLPFVSYGGSALVTNLYAIGIILNASKFRRKKIEDSSINNRWHRRSYISRPRGR